jgi:hypothetical protein
MGRCPFFADLFCCQARNHITPAQQAVLEFLTMPVQERIASLRLEVDSEAAALRDVLHHMKDAASFLLQSLHESGLRTLATAHIV